MSAENVELIRRSFDAYATTGAIEWDLIDPNVEVRDFDLPDAAGEVFRGHEGYRRWVSVWSTAWQDWELEPKELIDADDRVIAVFRLSATGMGSGIETERLNSAVFTVQDGKVTRCDYYGTREGAFEACRS
jgi:ketosteroid isomerase-like protein